MKYKCPKCGAIAEIDTEKKTITIEVPPPKLPEPMLGQYIRSSSFPSHPDCELGKPIDKIQLEKLEKIDYTFLHERGRPH